MYKNCRNGRYSTGSHLFRFPLNTNPRQNYGSVTVVSFSCSFIMFFHEFSIFNVKTNATMHNCEM